MQLILCNYQRRCEAYDVVVGGLGQQVVFVQGVEGIEERGGFGRLRTHGVLAGNGGVVELLAQL